MFPENIPVLTAHGCAMPQIGFGTSQLGDCADLVANALKLGYRHIDTAWKYKTEKGVGDGIRASGVPPSPSRFSALMPPFPSAQTWTRPPMDRRPWLLLPGFGLTLMLRIIVSVPIALFSDQPHDSLK